MIAKKSVKLIHCCLVIFLHLFFDDRFDLSGDFGWPPGATSPIYTPCHFGVRGICVHQREYTAGVPSEEA